ncbi:tetratricopeptide repeat protein [bacterium]|nr:tetratricopeptide repeat protein [bacterium]
MSQKPVNYYIKRDNLTNPIVNKLFAEADYCQSVLTIANSALNTVPFLQIDTDLYTLISRSLQREFNLKLLSYTETQQIVLAARVALINHTGDKTVYINPIEILPPPDKLDHWIGRADGIYYMGYMFASIACCDRAIEMSSVADKAWAYKGRALAFLGMQFCRESMHKTHCIYENLIQPAKLMEDAIACFDQAIQLNPKNCDAIYDKGSCLIEMGRPGRDFKKVDEAIQCFERVLRIEPEHNNAKTALDMCREK